MGVSANLVPTIIGSVRQFGLGGDLLQLGRQDIALSPQTLEEQLAQEGLAALEKPTDWATNQNGLLTSEAFFGALGFRSADSMDVCDAEGARLIFDLNQPLTPPELIGKYDVIFDGGTLEHVFNLPNGLRHCAEMLKNNGWLIHIGPLNNYVDHGFYQFSPTLWFDWLGANGWSIYESALVRLPAQKRPDADRWEFSHLPVGRLGEVGALDDAPYMQYLVARKGPAARGDVIPMQGLYAKRYRNLEQSASTLGEFVRYHVANGRRAAPTTDAGPVENTHRARMTMTGLIRSIWGACRR